MRFCVRLCVCVCLTKRVWTRLCVCVCEIRCVCALGCVAATTDEESEAAAPQQKWRPVVSTPGTCCWRW